MKYVIFSKISDFPYSVDAFSEKTRLMCLSINHRLSDYEAFVLNLTGKKGRKEGVYSGIKYKHMIGCSSSNKLLRLCYKPAGFIYEFIFLLKLSKKKQIGGYLLSYSSFIFVIYYRILSLILGFPLIINIMEYHISLSKKNMSIFYKINAYLFDRFSFSFADAAFPISHFLSNYIKKHHPQLKQLLLPSFTDFEEINNVTKSQEISMKYFMYCGSSAYMDVVYFMIDSYMTIGHGDIKLLLVLNGSGIEKTYQYVKKKNAEDKVIIKSKLTHDALFSYYKQATALLIPLRDTQQDQARFPHKISEYLATGRPIVTTAVGEVNYYLQDMETAYIASAYTLTEFAYKMKSVILDEEMANRIGENGRLYGSKIFDYKQYGEQIISFIDRL